MKLQLLTRLWLGAALMVQAQDPTSTAESMVQPSDSAVTFEFRSPTPRIYNTTTTTMDQVRCGVELGGKPFHDFANITLYSRTSTAANAASLAAVNIPANIETPSMQGLRRSEEPPNFSTNLLFQRTINSLYFSLDTNASEIIIQLNSLQAFTEELLFFMIFQNGDDTGGSSSPYFAVINPSSGTSLTFKDNNIHILSTTDTAELDPTSSNASATHSGNGTSETGVSVMHGQGTGHKGGLATGAIAGIAVGAAIALILVAALVWYILRRRQRISSHPTEVSTPLAAGYGGAVGVGSRDFMGDKEAGAMIAESPQSQAYTDQPDPRHSTLSGAAIIGSAAAAPANASYTESGHQAYDEPVPAGHSPTDQQPPHHGSASGIRGVDSPVPSASVARHLVDEDMTADEIARLEEEERELDRQIQEAGRRRQ